MRKYFYCLVTVFMISFMTTSFDVYADEEVTIQATVGWNGEYKGDFVPINVKVTNKGENKSGKVKLIAENPKFSRDKLENISHEKSLNLPSGATKEVQLIVPSDLLKEAEIVWSVDGIVQDSQPLIGKKLPGNSLAVGVLTDQPNTELWVKQQVAPLGTDYYVYSLHAKQIPEQGRGLSSLDVLIIDDLSQKRLSKDKQAAIVSWIADGGKLLIGGGQSTDQFPTLNRILPLQLAKQTQKIKVPEKFQFFGSPITGQMMLRTGKIANNSKKVIAGSNQVVLAKRKFQKGKIFVTGYRLGEEPFRSWNGNQKLWSELFLMSKGQYKYYSHHPSNQADGPVFDNLYQIKQVLEESPLVQIPSIGIMAMFFFLYFLVILPAVYYWMIKKKQRDKLWFAIPIVAVLTSVCIYAYGNLSRNDEIPLYQVGFVNTDASGLAQVQAYNSFVSDDLNDYHISSKTFMYPMLLDSSDDNVNAKVDIGSQSHIDFTEVPQWTLRRFYQEDMVPLNGSLSGTIQLNQNREYRAVVVNQTKLPLKDVQLMIGRKGKSIGNLAPKEKKIITFKEYELDNVSLSETKEDLYQAYTRIEKGMRLIGWTDQKMVSSEINNYETESKGLFLVTGSVQLGGNQSKNVVLSEEMIDYELVSSSESVRNKTSSNNYYLNKQGEMIFRYQLGHQKWKHISKLDIDTPQSYYSPKYIQTTYEVYNWSTKKWESITSLKQNALIDYVSNSQELYLRVKGEKVQVPDITVEGTVA